MKKFLLSVAAALHDKWLAYATRTGLILWDMGGGGQQQQPTATTQTVNQVTIPEYAKPYAENLLGKAAALTDTNQNPYQPYSGQQVAGFSPLQQQSFNSIGSMQTSPQNGIASGLALNAGQTAMGAGSQYTPGQFGTQQYTDPGVAQSYMNPYMRNVVDYQSSEAIRNYQKTLPQEQALAVSKGAFGGNRQAINQSEMQRNLGAQLAGIAATGSAQAYQQGAQQFTADQGQALQGAQLGEQSRQYGAGLGLQGLQTGIQAAGQLGQLGNQDFTQQSAINQQQQQAGLLQQQNQQQVLNTDYQKYADQLNYPYKQLGFMQGIVQGLPIAQNAQSVYQAPPTTTASLASLGLGAYGLSGLLGKKKGGVVKMADGGKIGPSMESMGDAKSGKPHVPVGDHKYASGGLADQYKMMDTASNMPDHVLAQSSSVPDYVKAAIMHSRGQLRTAMPPREEPAPGVAGLPAPNMEQMADGGIVGYAEGGKTYDYTDYYGRRPGKVGFNDVAPGMGVMEKLRTAFGIDSTPIDANDMSIGAKLRASVGVPVAGAAATPSAVPPGYESSYDVASLQANKAARDQAMAEFVASQQAAGMNPQAAQQAAAQQAAAQQTAQPPAGIAAVAGRRAAAPAPVAPEAPPYEPEPAKGIAELMREHREATAATEAQNPLYAKLKKHQDRAEGLSDEIGAYKEKSPYLMALAAAKEFAQPGRGTFAAIGDAAGKAGEVYAQREQQADRMGIQALDAQTKVLAIEDALRRGDSATAEKLIAAAGAERTRVAGFKERMLERKMMTDAQRYVADKGYQGQVDAAGIHAAARASMVNDQLKLGAQRDALMKSIEAAAEKATADALKANPMLATDPAAYAALKAKHLTEIRAANQARIDALDTKLGISALQASPAAGSGLISALPPGAQVAGSL